MYICTYELSMCYIVCMYVCILFIYSSFSCFLVLFLCSLHLLRQLLALLRGQGIPVANNGRAASIVSRRAAVHCSWNGVHVPRMAPRQLQRRALETESATRDLRGRHCWRRCRHCLCCLLVGGCGSLGRAFPASLAFSCALEEMECWLADWRSGWSLRGGGVITDPSRANNSLERRGASFCFFGQRSQRGQESRLTE